MSFEEEEELCRYTTNIRFSLIVQVEITAMDGGDHPLTVEICNVMKKKNLMLF